jgi:4-hydroxy-tetrahydrodipicolinate synthase
MEGSADPSRIGAIRALMEDRMAVCVGADDTVVDGISAGAVAWISGLANALPGESMRLFDLVACDGPGAARGLHEWIQPLLRLERAPKSVQLMKLLQQEVGMGRAAVRPPRLELVGKEVESALVMIRECLAKRPGGP